MRPLHMAAAAAAIFACALWNPSSHAADVGVAKVDITPSYNVRLSGFAHRKTESEGVDGKLYAKALAFDEGGADGPAVLLAVDSLGVPDYMTRDVAARLETKAKLDPKRFAVT